MAEKPLPLFENLAEVRDGRAVVADFIHQHRDAVLSPNLQTAMDQRALARAIGDLDDFSHFDAIDDLQDSDHGFHRQTKVNRSAALRMSRDVKYGRNTEASTRGAARRVNSQMREALSARGLYRAAWREEYLASVQERKHFLPFRLVHKPSARRKRLAAEGSEYVASMKENFDNIINVVAQANIEFGRASGGHIATKEHRASYRSGVLSYEEFVAELRADGHNVDAFSDTGDVDIELEARYETFLNAWSRSADNLVNAADNGNIIDYVGTDPRARLHALNILASSQQANIELDLKRSAMLEDLQLMENAARTSARWFALVASVTPRTPLGRMRNFTLRHTVTPVVSMASKAIATAMKIGFIPLHAAEKNMARYAGYGPIHMKAARAIGHAVLSPINRLYSKPMNKIDNFASHRENVKNEYTVAKEAAREASTRLQTNMQEFAAAAVDKGASDIAAEALVSSFGTGVANDLSRGYEPAIAIVQSLGMEFETDAAGQPIWTPQHIQAMGQRFIMRPYDREATIDATGSRTTVRVASQAINSPRAALGPATPDLGGL